jgi:hypothetical protein
VWGAVRGVRAAVCVQWCWRIDVSAVRSCRGCVRDVLRARGTCVCLCYVGARDVASVVCGRTVVDTRNDVDVSLLRAGLVASWGSACACAL